MDLSPKGFSTASKDGPLPNPAARQQQFIGQASRIIRRQEHRNRRNIVGLSSRPQKRNRLRELLQITPDNACAMRTFRLDHARFDRVHLNFLRRQFFRKHVRHRIDRTLACGIHARSRPVARGYAEPTLMMLPPSEPKYFSAPGELKFSPRSVDVWKGMAHGCQSHIGQLAASTNAIDEIGRFLADRLQASASAK